METEKCEVLLLLRLNIPVTVTDFKQTPIKGLSPQKSSGAFWFLSLKEQTSRKVFVEYDNIRMGDALKTTCRIEGLQK